MPLRESMIQLPDFASMLGLNETYELSCRLLLPLGERAGVRGDSNLTFRDA
jgi:hypothetical protein